TIPSNILFPVVLILCLVGAYASSNSMHTIGITLTFGVLGYVLTKFEFPLPPLLVGMILGQIAENALRHSLIISDGRMMIFLTRPISVIFFILILGSVLFPLIRKRFNLKGLT